MTTPTAIEALAELVALEDLSNRIDGAQFDTLNTSDAELQSMQDEYDRRRFPAWAAARAVLAAATQDQPKDQPALVLDLAMMLRTCAWALRRGTSPDLGERALELLKRNGLLGSPLRDQGESEQRAPATSLSAASSISPDAWRQIETAPKDEPGVLLLVPRPDRSDVRTVMHGRWFGGYWVGFNADRAVQRISPTHWMPLPASPTTAAVQSESNP